MDRQVENKHVSKCRINQRNHQTKEGDEREHSSEIIRKKHLDWSAKQSRMITGNGRVNDFYTANRGFPFEEWELPHYYCFASTNSNSTNSCSTRKSRDILDEWRSSSANEKTPLCGVWKRVLLEGGMEHSTDQDEIVWNIQSNTLFIDLRIPTTKSLLLSSLYCSGSTSEKKTSDASSANPLRNCSKEELALYARQHVFCGYTVQQQKPNGNNNTLVLCTRHHCIDWNYIGTPRSRPNKWYAEFSSDLNTFKEWSYATDFRNQSYYTETWKRIVNSSTKNDDEKKVVVSLRISEEDRHKADISDGIIVAIGDHFNYAIDRRPRKKIHDYFDLMVEKEQKPANFVDYIDFVLQTEDRDKLISRLTSIDAGHGRIISSSQQNQWMIDCALQPWKHSSNLFPSAFSDDNFTLIGGMPWNDVQNCQLVWNHLRWDIYECSLPTLKELAEYLGCAVSTIRNTSENSTSKL
jgi:hypothetical protein